MKNKIIVILVLLLAISLLASVTIFAYVDTNFKAIPEDKPVEPSKVDIFIQREVEEKNKVVSNSDGKETPVSYDRTMNISMDEQVDIYVDDERNEFLFNKDGTIRSFIKSNSNATGSDKNEAFATDKTSGSKKDIAADFARKMYGEDLFGKFKYKSTYTMGGNMPVVEFSIVYDGFEYITGPICSVTFNPDGTVAACQMPGYEKLADFNESLLKGISKEKLNEFTKEQIYAAYSTVTSYTVNSYELCMTPDGYAIKIVTNISYDVQFSEFDTMETTIVEVFYYELAK